MSDEVGVRWDMARRKGKCGCGRQIGWANERGTRGKVEKPSYLFVYLRKGESE